MCGLFGMAGSIINRGDIEIFKDLAWMSAPRGIDSTGVLTIKSDSKRENVSTTVTKAVTNPIEFFSAERVTQAFSDAQDIRALAGHVRARSVGEIKFENAHPFEFQNLVGMHNGTILKPFEGRQDYGTDSEAFFALLNSMSLEEALKEIASHTAAFAFIWFDKRNNTLNFYRNKERSLWFGISAQTLFWASEPYVVKGAVVRHGQDFIKDSWAPVPVETLVSIPLNTYNIVNKISSTPLKMPDPPSNRTVYYGGKWDNYGNDHYNFPWRNEEKERKFFSDDVDKKEDTSCKVPFVTNNKKDKHTRGRLLSFTKKDKEERTIRVFNSEMITKDMFDKRTINGCTYCSCDLTPDDTIVWFDVTEPVCEECASLDWLKEYYQISDTDIESLTVRPELHLN